MWAFFFLGIYLPHGARYSLIADFSIYLEYISIDSRNASIACPPGQNSRNLDFLFAGKFLGTDADITDGSLRHYDFNTFSHLDSDYYVPPRFMEAIALFITKNSLASTELKNTINVPLVMGVWGEKGCGKTFIT